jgi:hypothetical protein
MSSLPLRPLLCTLPALALLAGLGASPAWADEGWRSNGRGEARERQHPMTRSVEQNERSRRRAAPAAHRRIALLGRPPAAGPPGRTPGRPARRRSRWWLAGAPPRPGSRRRPPPPEIRPARPLLPLLPLGPSRLAARPALGATPAGPHGLPSSAGELPHGLPGRTLLVLPGRLVQPARQRLRGGAPAGGAVPQHPALLPPRGLRGPLGLLHGP